MGKTPYSTQPDYAFWSRAHRDIPYGDIDPVVKGGFILKPEMKLATAGSCFAQHLAKHLQSHGFNYLVTEEAHPAISYEVAAKYNYGTFSARYGNIYTVRQLLQMAHRVNGDFKPVDDVWRDGDAYIDPFRPNIQPGGFSSREELLADRERHFEAIREIFKQSDVFIFTFGLTEAWQAEADGAVFPLCPGVNGGEFSHDKYEFVNYTVDEIVNDFMEFTDILRGVNPNVKIIMTVSPVPLIATARDESVITATCYSKSVLRVAAETLAQKIQDAYYFPSYEVITGNFNRGAYFEEDLRQVRKEGVDHVMRLFMQHYTDNKPVPMATKTAPAAKSFVEEMQTELEVICDEELIETRGA
ncbi:MAG: GSCFA domain-containing protein [bacterium]